MLKGSRLLPVITAYGTYSDTACAYTHPPALLFTGVCDPATSVPIFSIYPTPLRSSKTASLSAKNRFGRDREERISSSWMVFLRMDSVRVFLEDDPPNTRTHIADMDPRSVPVPPMEDLTRQGNR
jgi:hypothetical protein